MISAIAAPPAHIIAQQGVQPTEAKDPGRKASLEEVAVSPNDKSQDNAQVQLTTPSSEFKTELTRQEAVSDVQFRITQNALDQSGVVPGNDNGSVQNAALAETEVSEVAPNPAQEPQENNSPETADTNSGANSELPAPQQFSQAADAYIQQSLFSDPTENAGLSITA